MEISPFIKTYIPEAAALFVENYKMQRLVTPVLPDLMEDQEHVEKMLNDCFEPSSGLMALEHGKLFGYIGWFLVEHFRGTERKGAYIPEWGHGSAGEQKATIYQAIYRVAGEAQSAAGCQVHAITLLAHDHSAKKTWFWNGFGLTVVDAIRPMRPLEVAPYTTDLRIRKATLEDVTALTELDAEHWLHYSRSPIFMTPRSGKDAVENIEFLSHPKNSIWLAEEGDKLAGFIRFEGYDFDTAAILEAEDGVTITGAYVRPEYRGQRAAVALLDAAMRDYQQQRLEYCGVNFESFNPEAASFWMKYFEPVCYSVLRVPES